MGWQIQEAKQRFSALIDAALREGPQTVTKHGREVAIVIEVGEYRRLCADAPNLKQFLLGAPDLSELDLPRSADLPRQISLT